MPGPLAAGVVGVGHLGQHHARLYASLRGVRLAGVVDTDPNRAQEVASRYGARVFADVPSLAREVDLASVATPTTSHEECVLPLLDAGVAVLVEKPIAADVAAADRMIQAAERAGAPLMVGHTERFHPAVAALRERLSRPRFIESHRLAPFAPRSLDVDVLLDLMIHDLDLLRVLLDGDEVVRFDASGAAALTERIDIASVRLRFKGGAAANLTASRISHERQRRIRVFEPGAYFACDTGRGTLSVHRLVRDGPKPRIATEEVAVPREEPLARELSQFRDAVVRGERPPCPGEDGRAALALALEIREAITASL
ncbi:MAG: gfo/Idh/MocA family oxidoreductase [Acidobacteria bacterium]|nr:MAG: gfo/Idh/MocA family oxidoreductase [Acidobacteriota bacterium]